MLPASETARLSLRRRTIADFEACLAMDRDPEVVKYIPGPWDDATKHEAFLRERIQADFGDGLGYWSIYSRDAERRFLGWILLIPYDGTGPKVEIGWRLNRSAWGRGYGTEAALPFVSYAFEDIGLPEIVADIDIRNVASHRIAEKIGMQHVGDIVHDSIPMKSYALTRYDWR
ncbi:GNAT family N-acetyltransferase [Bosea sp. NBC_00550]|uniref:GNAT family N-acetyltransferase n=1 Tax=Bosea sp. NBC_00550 TaxID=2969621 RepID=UPI00222F929A|nr:GNAT family N-acetyltransferase [Bosea sp. NBC_00550]UZF95209.1 GNAT family N-acetyltransferase [Bosea sp. NBC_00550]